MVAYSFMTQFQQPILQGTKQHTLRAPRSGRARHARVGDELQLYVGLRTKACRRLGIAHCRDRRQVLLRTTKGGLGRPRHELWLGQPGESWTDAWPHFVWCHEAPANATRLTSAELRRFVIADGFPRVSEFWAHWQRQAQQLHQPTGQVSLELIGWGETFLADDAQPLLDVALPFDPLALPEEERVA